MPWLSVIISVLTLLTVCRLTRLVTEDSITAPLRDWVAHKASHPTLHIHPPARPGGHPGGQQDAPHPGGPAPTPPSRLWRWTDKLINCPWCIGFWISAVVNLAYFKCWLGLWPTDTVTAFSYAVSVFATSWLTAILAEWLDSPPPPRVITLTPAQLDVVTRPAPPIH